MCAGGGAAMATTAILGGPYCPACAVKVADELIELREQYRD